MLSATLSRRQPLPAASLLQTFSKLFPNFLQIFGCFLQAFPNFCLAVLGNFKGLGAENLETGLFGFFQIFVPRCGELFAQRTAPAVRWADGGGGSRCQTAETHPTTDFEKQKDFCGFCSPWRFFVGRSAADPCADLALFRRWGVGKAAKGWRAAHPPPGRRGAIGRSISGEVWPKAGGGFRMVVGDNGRKLAGSRLAG